MKGREFIKASGRKACDFRHAPKATDNRFRATCRDGPEAEVQIKGLSRPPVVRLLLIVQVPAASDNRGGPDFWPNRVLRLLDESN